MQNAKSGVLHFISNRIFISLILILATGSVLAHGGQTLGDVAGNITKSMSGLARLITATSYVAGVGFAMMGMLKLKAHKDQPAQVPLGQPIMLLVIAVGLIFLPNLINTGGNTIWGDQANQAEARSSYLDIDNFG
ncbi:MAG: type IV secretion protein IcmD [Candidatus Berkiella sp.]